MKNKIEIYQTSDNQTQVNVQFEKDTVWLSQKTMAQLFQTTVPNINIHLKSIFQEGELEELSTIKDFLIVQKEGKRDVKRKQKLYNLDVIISVGYRIKSRVATQFRIWATQRLKDYLVKGYAINEQRLQEKQQEVEYLKTGIRIIGRAIEAATDETNFEMFQLFSKGLELLDDYDHETLDKKGLSEKEAVYPTFDEYMAMIRQMYSEFESAVFALPKDAAILTLEFLATNSWMCIRG